MSLLLNVIVSCKIPGNKLLIHIFAKFVRIEAYNQRKQSRLLPSRTFGKYFIPKIELWIQEWQPSAWRKGKMVYGLTFGKAEIRHNCGKISWIFQLWMVMLGNGEGTIWKVLSPNCVLMASMTEPNLGNECGPNLFRSLEF